MKARQTVESYWSVWIWTAENRGTNHGMWEPYDEGFSTKRAALAQLRENREQYPDRHFALVRTINTRRPA